jgi:O-acetyl-ADP-ribose deacetylase (regulator of RNase III)
MPDESSLLKREFQFGSTTVKIIEGTILSPGVKVNAVVSTDDNYLTMGGGVAKMLRTAAASEQYVRSAQDQCPVKAGTVVVTKAYRLKDVLGADYVFHGTVIDYDTSDLSLEDLVERTTANCLAQAEERGLQSILFPAMATGSGRLNMDECARRMCSAIKAYLAQERPLKEIYLILHLPSEPKDETERAKFLGHKAENVSFIMEANLVLGVPYDPTLAVRQARDFFGRKEELQTLEDIITGKKDVEGKKRHAVVLGGSGIGKWAILDQLYYRAQQPGSPLGVGRRLVKLTFGRVHKNTPQSFIYRKFLCALEEEARASQADAKLVKEIRSLYAEEGIGCSEFLAFLARHPDRYQEVVFLIDELPNLLKMEGEDTQGPTTVRTFWRDLDSLQERVRFVYTGQAEAYERLCRERLETYTTAFKEQIEEVWLRCVTDQERIEWVDALFNLYLDCSNGALGTVHDFFEDNAGRHPYLISLAGYHVLAAIKRDLLTHPEQDVAGYDTLVLSGFLENARQAMEPPRRKFFESLVDSLDHEHRFDLEYLAKAVILEETERGLIPAVLANDPNVNSQLQELAREGDPRESLHPDRLRRMEDNGLLVDAAGPKSAKFMAKPFAAYIFEIQVKSAPPLDQPQDVVISLLSSKEEMVRTIVRGRGARATMSEKPLTSAVRAEFMQNFSGYIRQRFHPDQASGAQPSAFCSTEEVSNYILTQFATVEIKRYLGSISRFQIPTILLMVEDAYKDIPWELMVEAVYAGEIPFRVGRSIVSQQSPQNVKPPVRGLQRIKALLIGDPAGNLDEAQAEVERLSGMLRGHPELFDEPDLLVGPEQCKRIQLLNALSSGRYGIVHYSGHTQFKDDQSAWQLRDSLLTTDMLTSAVQMAPPAFVFSSSCESAVAAKQKPIAYESQSFDLPGAFLQAGVEAYIGTLWQVDSTAARLLSEKFYEAFLSNAGGGDREPSLGECLRQAKWALKQQEERNNQINWLSFILYGDPHLRPSDLFPLMRK